VIARCCRIARKITAAALSAAAVVAFLPPGIARAGTAVLWACHGPTGQPLGAGPLAGSALGDGVVSSYGQGCASQVASIEDGGLGATFSRADPRGGSVAAWQMSVPSGVVLQSVRLARMTTGLGGPPIPGDPQIYAAQTSSMALESSALNGSNTALTGVSIVDPAQGDWVRLSVTCQLPGQDRCSAPPSGTVGGDFSSVALTIDDSNPPRGAVSGLRSPAAGVLSLSLSASDVGLGLARARATLDGQTKATAVLAGPSCGDLSPASATIDLPLGATCPLSASGAPLSVDTRAVADGTHTLRVFLTDAAGNSTTVVNQVIDVANTPPRPSSTVLIGVGNGQPSNNGGPGPGIIGGNGSVACESPRLSVRLAQRPVRRSKHGVPVLRRAKRYLFRGRLTCLRNGSRVAAPNNAVVHIVVRWKRTWERNGTTVRRGRIEVIQRFYRAKAVIFRYVPKAGRPVQVRLRILVTRR
jgi:hypothetical protein